MPTYLLTSDEMRRADQATIAAGTPEKTLMQRAGGKLAETIQSLYTPCPTVFICGRGNNGGDGRIAAELLQQHNWPITILTPEDGITEPLTNTKLIIDGIFGTGLDRPISGDYAKLVEAINASPAPVIAVDIPSGINATTGEIMGTAIKANHTVSFATAKCGHYLLPGKAHTGTLHVVDIGITQETIAATNPTHLLNTPELWQLPKPSVDAHKYARGAALVMGGELTTTGAAKLTANAALKIGAGLVSVICNEQTLPIYAASLTAVMTKLANNMDEFQSLISEPRITALAIGPGAGTNRATVDHTTLMLQRNIPIVLDADALQQNILKSTHKQTIITPHTGEFKRLFGEYSNKLEAVNTALAAYQGVLVYKGNDTIIAQAGKPIIINGNAPPTLATAGSGDVLAGIILGLLAQHMEPFAAACAAVWLHGNIATKLGDHFTAEDLVTAI